MHWNIAFYIRLSKEDGNDESLSISNQRKILLDYLDHDFHAPYTLKKICIDDGKSGTDAARPAFQDLLRLISSGEVNCILCKSLSRAFRNYADQGYYLETYFPQYQVRFITVSEPKVDTYLHPELLWGLEIPINGILNDRYACRTSSDIRRTFQTKRRNGEFIGAFPPYGYQKDPLCKNHLIPDEEAARIVQQIFRWYTQNGCSKEAIARTLNAKGIPNPTAYKQKKGLPYHHPSLHNDGLWQASSISSILSNEIYTGTMVQGKQETISYKVHRRRSIPKENWVKVPGTHLPIISSQEFLDARKIQQAHRRPAAQNTSPHTFSGLLYCNDCQKAMTRTISKHYTYFHCSTYKRKSKLLCSPHTVRQDTLEAAILSLIQTFWTFLYDPVVTPPPSSLSRQLLLSLIQEIRIGKNGEIFIFFRFRNPFVGQNTLHR